MVSILVSYHYMVNCLRVIIIFLNMFYNFRACFLKTTIHYVDFRHIINRIPNCNRITAFFVFNI